MLPLSWSNQTPATRTGLIGSGWDARVVVESTRAQRGGLVRHHDFRRLWAGQTVSAIGSQVSFVAVSLVAIFTLQATTFSGGCAVGGGVGGGPCWSVCWPGVGEPDAPAPCDGGRRLG